MELRKLVVEDDAVSSTIGVVLMIAVTVILAAAVGTFALGLAEESTKQTPSASIEVEWATVGVDDDDAVDITILGGDSVKSKFVTVVHQDGTELWADGPKTDVSTYDSKTWDGDEIQSGDTLGLQEDSNDVFQSGDTVKVIWNNGQKSMVLGSGTLN